jgi:chromosome segregation ATPase
MPLPPNRLAAIEHGLAEYQHTLAERDRLAEELRQAEDRHKLAAAEIEMRDRTIAELHRRVAELEHDRDRKVGDFAVMETLFMSIRAQLDAFVKLPSPSEETPAKPQTE